jgi:sulfite reductase beta subunit-like hemoprotein
MGAEQTMSTTDWRGRLLESMPPDLAEEIDIFEGQMELRRKDKIEDRVFAETRLRRGVYGQRYDNGHRHDGVASQTLTFPAGDLTKGPETLWDAPGMMRIKIPYGGVTPDQLDVIAELAEEYSDGILHVTTRQDVQLHYVHIDDTPDLMRRLASVGITTREACGNGVRNLTACPIAGVCHTEAFDTTAYAAALFRFLLGHPDCQDFGRKFKPAFSGCAGEACGLVMMHDFGAIARTSMVDGDDRWTSYLPSVEDYTESPVREAVPAPANGAPLPDGYREWLRTNVYRQRQPGYAVATVALPLGDLSSAQTRKLSEVARRYVGDAVRTTVEQNIVLRWVAEGDLPALYQDLVAIDLAAPGAGTIVDVTSCPGTDTCKLGIASSRGLAGELRTRLAAKQFELDEAVRGLRIKVSGCFNSCGQHHVADIGFFGNSRKINGVTVPHFQVVLGGRWRENAGSYGLAIGSVPSKRIPEVVDAITSRFVTERDGDESFQDWIARLGKKELGAMIGELKTVPPVDEDPSFYTDWGDARVFTMGDMGIGECAGEVISSTDLELTMAESIAFDAQVALEDGDLARADERAYAAMVAGARALVRTEHPNVPDDPDTIVREFRTRFYDTERFFDRFAKGRFARPLFDRHDAGPPAEHQDEATRSLVEESQLFIDAVHAMEIREAGAQSALV